MSESRIPKALRQKITEHARHRCGYCLTSEFVVGAPMEVDHLIPLSLGGPTDERNLWLACPLCNEHKSDRIAAIDPQSGVTVRLFNPRIEIWIDHFTWNENADRIVGLTPTGRATVIALNLNRPSLVRARQAWVLVGWHPPKD
jgi:hypothetical protein